MSESTSGPDLFNILADEFAERYRRGERPPLSEYIEKYPALASQIHELFPALLAIEQFGSGADLATGLPAPRPETAGPIPERLGDYRILREIARGGMGIVYEAVQESLGRHVALKVLPQYRMRDPNQLERFQREARAAAILHHTNIVPVFGVGEHDGVHHYAMQYIQGQGLDVVLGEVKQMRGLKPDEPAPASIRAHAPGLAASVAIELVSGRFEGHGAAPAATVEMTASRSPASGKDAATTSLAAGPGSSSSDWSILGQSESAYYRSVALVGVQAAEALEYAHQHKLLHRDIKPSNLLLDLQGTIWITDFGLVKAEGTDGLTHTGDVVGTLRYMAPERFRGQGDARSDVYALGLTLYEMLTLEPAFAADERSLLIDKILHEEPSKPRQIDPRIPLDLETIALKAVAKDPSDRYRSASLMAEDLRRYLADRPILARRASALERTRRWCRRNPALAALTALVAAALTAVAVLALLYADRQTKATLRITALADNLKTSLADSNRLLAVRNFDRGQAAFEQGEIGPGMLWMIESWRSAVDAGDSAWQHAARANLAAWRPQYPRLRAVLSHSMPVVRAFFSPDSRTVVSASMDGTAQLWDAASGHKIGSPLGVGGQDFHMAFSPDGKIVVTACEEAGPMAQLWDATTGEPLGLPLRLRPQTHILGVAIQPGRKLVLIGSEVSEDNVLTFRDAVSGQPIGPSFAHHGHIYPPALSADGRLVLTPSNDGTARLWNTATGQPIGPPLKHPGGFRCAAFSPDGKTIVTGSSDGTAQLWDAATCQPVGLPMRHESDVRAVALSTDNKLVCTGGPGNEARLWDAATGQSIGFLGHLGGISAIAFSGDGKSVLTGSLDRTVRLWDVEPGNTVGEVLEIPSTDTISGVRSLGTNGKVLISCPKGVDEPRYVRLWNATTRLPIARLPQPGGNVAMKFSPDGKYLLTTEADHTARLWDATTGAALGAPFPLPSSVLPAWSPVRLGPDGRAVLFVGKDRRVWILDPAAGSVRGRTPALNGIAFGLEFSPDGKTFFTGLDNGEVRLWDAATATPLGEPIRNPGGISCGLFSPDGRSLLIVCEDGSGRLWDLATRRPLITPLRHQGSIYDTAFSPDGKTIATSSLDKTVRLWDVATGHPIGPILRHTGKVFSVAFRPDGRALFTASIVSRLFPIPPDLPDELERVAAWVEVITGLRLDKEEGMIQVLDNAAWLARRERLVQLGGPPETRPEQRLDSILFGPDPTARAQLHAAEAVGCRGRRFR